MPIFQDRRDAGTKLAQTLQGFAELPDVVVLALSPGGVPIAYEIATALQVPLEVLHVGIDVGGHTVIVVDDGLPRGSVMRAAVAVLRVLRADLIVVAVPVADPAALADVHPHADEIVSVLTPDVFGRVGDWYRDFAPPSDDEVRMLLEDADRMLRDRGSSILSDEITS
jgi:predicted phosphoribosyltransferase